jgi:hypothetical protein
MRARGARNWQIGGREDCHALNEPHKCWIDVLAIRRATHPLRLAYSLNRAPLAVCSEAVGEEIGGVKMLG